MKKVQVIGKLSDIYECKYHFPKLSYADMELMGESLLGGISLINE